MSESKSWKTPAAVIGIITVILTGIGIYLNKKGDDREIQKQNYQQQVDETNKLERENKQKEIQNRISELNVQLNEAINQVTIYNSKIQETYRQIQDYNFKQNDPNASAPARAADHESYLIARENLDIFSQSKKDFEARADEIRKEINDLTK